MIGKKKITCRDFLEHVSDYVDGAMAPDLRAKLEAHLTQCPDCWVEFDKTKMTVEIFQNVECHPLPGDVHDRLMATLEKHWNR